MSPAPNGRTCVTFVTLDASEGLTATVTVRRFPPFTYPDGEPLAADLPGDVLNALAQWLAAAAQSRKVTVAK